MYEHYYESKLTVPESLRDHLTRRWSIQNRIDFSVGRLAEAVEKQHRMVCGHEYILMQEVGIIIKKVMIPSMFRVETLDKA